MAPLDCAAQRVLARQGRSAARGEQPEHVVQSRGDLPGIEHPCARGCQLDGQGEPVEPAADLRDGGRGIVVQLERRPHGARSFDEQPRRLARGRRRARGGLGLGERERRHQPGVLAADAERFAARGQDAEPRAAA